MTEHVLEELYEYALDILDADRQRDVRLHLRECRLCSNALTTISNLFSEAIVESTSLAPPQSVRKRILGDVSSITPYALYHEKMLEILGGSKTALEDELGEMPHPKTWDDGPIPQCRLLPCNAGTESTDRIQVLVRMESGSHFPEHEHLGDETVLVLQGSMLHEDGTVYRPGDVLDMPKGSSHSFDVPDGLDLVYLAVVDKGIRIGDQLVTVSNL